MSERLKAAGLSSLNVTCTTSACEEGLHCFRPLRRGTHPEGSCRDCGNTLFDWGDVHRRARSELDNTVEKLQHEAIRHFYWCEPLTERARKYALRKGLSGLRVRVPRQLESRLGKVKSENAWDGRQTPGHKQIGRANAIDWAQHATATCCRVCLSYWHGIDVESPLTGEDYEYLSELVMRYLQHKLPDMGEQGVPQSPTVDGETG